VRAHIYGSSASDVAALWRGLQLQRELLFRHARVPPRAPAATRQPSVPRLVTATNEVTFAQQRRGAARTVLAPAADASLSPVRRPAGRLKPAKRGSGAYTLAQRYAALAVAAGAAVLRLRHRP